MRATVCLCVCMRGEEGEGRWKEGKKRGGETDRQTDRQIDIVCYIVSRGFVLTC